MSAKMIVCSALIGLLLLQAVPAWALDKQGSAHGGVATPATRGFNLSGGHFIGVALYNPSYAARPDNTGLALLRYGSHLDIDLIGQRLSIPVDLNVFTDAQNPDIAKLQPSEFDVIVGLTSTFGLGPGAIELGGRFEYDSPVDRGSFTQRYVDLRARYLFSLASRLPRLGAALWDGDISGWVTLGAFAWNPSYAARPDNSGQALMRYAAHLELSFFKDHISLGGDVTSFTDRTAAGAEVLRPSEIDATAEIIGKVRNVEVHLAYERDLPVDRPGLVQSFVYLLAIWTFDISSETPPPLTSRTAPVSP